MNKEKQIEEMQADLTKYIVRYADKHNIRYGDTAKNLFAAGYRKQSEVVRCRDCENFNPHGDGKAGSCNDTRNCGVRYADGFCSYGVRKESRPKTEAENIIDLILGKAKEFENITGRKPAIFMSRDILGILVNGMGREIVETDKCGVNHIDEYELKITRGVCELYVGFELKFEKRKENDHESKTENDF